jgi:hypothetical protein
VIAAIVGRPLQLPGRRCACPTSSALTLECAKRSTPIVRYLNERERPDNFESF